MLKLNKLKITAPIAHFKIPYTSKVQRTYLLPPPSTVIGMLQIIYGYDIDDFIFGYSFEYETLFKDIITIHKVWLDAIKPLGVSRNNNKPKPDIPADCCIREYLYNCKLNIYTSLNSLIDMKYTLCMGKSGCLARLHFPIKSSNDHKDIISNQYTNLNTNQHGIIQPINTFSKYDKETNSFNTIYKPLKLVENHNGIYLWKFKNQELKEVN